MSDEIVPPVASMSAPDSNLSSHEFLTAPNAFTLVRLCCLPLFLYLLIGRDNPAGAAWLLGGLGATDWVDGWLARRYNQVSEFGKIFDPTADRLLFIVSLTAIIVEDAAPRWVCIVILARELLVGATVAICTVAFHMKPFAVTWLGKLATFLLMFAVPGFMLGGSDFPGHTGFQIASWLLVVPGLAVSYWTGISYVPVIRKNVKAGRMSNVEGATR